MQTSARLGPCVLLWALCVLGIAGQASAETRETYPVCITHERWCVQVIGLRFVEVLPGPEVGTEISYERIVFGFDFKDEKTARASARRILKDGVCHMLEGDIMEECIPPHLVQSALTSFVP